MLLVHKALRGGSAYLCAHNLFDMFQASATDQRGFSPTPFVPDGPRPNDKRVVFCFFALTSAVYCCFLTKNSDFRGLIETLKRSVAFPGILKVATSKLNTIQNYLFVDFGAAYGE